MAKKDTQNTDEHHNAGGSYLIDKDGKRTLLHRTADAPASDVLKTVVDNKKKAT